MYLYGIMNFIFLSMTDLIVKCEPNLEKNMWIDHKNNLYYFEIDISELLNKGVYEFNCGGEKFCIKELKDLKLQRKNRLLYYKTKVYCE